LKRGHSIHRQFKAATHPCSTLFTPGTQRFPIICLRIGAYRRRIAADLRMRHRHRAGDPPRDARSSQDDVERDPMAVYRRGCIGESVLHWSAHNGTSSGAFPARQRRPIEADEIGLYGGKPLHWGSEHAPKSVKLLLEREPIQRAQQDRNEFRGLHSAPHDGSAARNSAGMRPNSSGCGPTKLTDARGHGLDVAVENGPSGLWSFLTPNR